MKNKWTDEFMDFFDQVSRLDRERMLKKAAYKEGYEEGIKKGRQLALQRFIDAQQDNNQDKAVEIADFCCLGEAFVLPLMPVGR